MPLEIKPICALLVRTRSGLPCGSLPETYSDAEVPDDEGEPRAPEADLLKQEREAVAQARAAVAKVQGNAVFVLQPARSLFQRMPSSSPKCFCDVQIKGFPKGGYTSKAKGKGKTKSRLPRKGSPRPSNPAHYYQGFGFTSNSAPAVTSDLLATSTHFGPVLCEHLAGNSLDRELGSFENSVLDRLNETILSGTSRVHFMLQTVGVMRAKALAACGTAERG